MGIIREATKEKIKSNKLSRHDEYRIVGNVNKALDELTIIALNWNGKYRKIDDLFSIDKILKLAKEVFEHEVSAYK